MFDTIITTSAQAKAGKVRAFAVSSLKRATTLPDVPTLNELGLKGFDITLWQGIFAPAGTDRAIVAKLHREIVKALKHPDVIEHLATRGGNDIIGNAPEQFAQAIESDLMMYAKLIKDAGIKAE